LIVCFDTGLFCSKYEKFCVKSTIPPADTSFAIENDDYLQLQLSRYF
jgi:hypothetical protein